MLIITCKLQDLKKNLPTKLLKNSFQSTLVLYPSQLFLTEEDSPQQEAPQVTILQDLLLVLPLVPLDQVLVLEVLTPTKLSQLET